MKHITSAQNALIKRVELLQRKSKARKQEQAFIVEGKREVTLCASGGYELQLLIICPAIIGAALTQDAAGVYAYLQLSQQPEVVTVTADVYEKIAYRSGTEGVIAIATAKSLALNDLQIKNNALILVAEFTEKPGNIGALLRTADAANVDAVILANPQSDVYNPNVVRSSVGCVFTVPIATASTMDTVAFLKEKNIALYAATLQSSKRYDLIDYKQASAIAVGTEATGLSQEMRDAATQNIIIPMLGTIDSMNVSVSAAIMIYEAQRQRGFNATANQVF